MVPEGWEKSTLVDYLDIKHGFAFKSEFFAHDGKYVLLTPGSFHEEGGFRDQGDKTKYYVGEIPTDYVLKKNDVLLAMTEQSPGLLGSAIYIPSENKYLHNQRLGLLEIKLTDRVCYDFLYLTYNSPAVRKQISEQASGTKVKHTSPDRLKSVVVLIPSLLEQKKIAQILSTWNQSIAITEKLLANSQQQKKALMQQLLGTGEDSIYASKVVFKRYRLSGLVDIDANNLGKNTPANFYFKYISLSDVETGNISSKLAIHRYESAPSRARRVVSEGDVLFATVRPNLQGFAKINGDHSGCIASTGFAVLTPKKDVCGDFIYHYLFSSHITGQINALVVGTNYPAINSSDVAGLAIYCPAYDEQKKIADILNACDQEIQALQQKLTHLKQEKKSLMQQLLTGKRRVKPDPTEAPTC